MKSHDNPRLLARLTPEAKAWLAYRAALNNRSQNAELQSIIEEQMRGDPLKIYVHEVIILDFDKVYTASIGEYGDDFIETSDRDQAIAAASAKAQQLGLPKSALTFNIVSDKAAGAAS